MPQILKPLDQNMRQRLASTFSGDAKPGSIRANLVRGLLGSQVGDDEGLVGMTPMGAVMNVDAANRDMRAGGSGMGKTLSAAAGMIPGPGGKIGREALEAASDLYRTFSGDTKRVVQELVANGFEKNEASAAADHIHITQSGIGRPSKNDATLKPSNLGAIQKRNPNDISRDTQLEGHIEQIQDRAELAKGKGIPPGTYVQDGDNITPGDALRMSVEDSRQLSPEEELHAISGGDAAKMNFIKNAMDDEGGNVPEDVARTYLDHLQERNPRAFEDLRNGDTSIETRDLAQAMADTHSIPEMLGMHYDLNPEMMSKAYAEAPADAAKVMPRKPTQ